MANLDLSDGKMKNVRAVVWRKEGDKRLFLITQECGGGFTIPGGCKDLEDKDLEGALERELCEELGLAPKDYLMSRIDWEKEYEDLYRNPKSERYQKNTIIYPFLVHMKGRVPLILPPDEIRGAIWLEEQDARRVLRDIPHMKEIFEIGLKALENQEIFSL